MADVKTISTDTLQNWLQTGKEVSIIDIRPIKECIEWFIPRSVHFNAYDKLKANKEDAFKGLHLEKNIPVILVCASGKTSLVGTELLQKKGYEAYSLEGGMRNWTLAWNTAKISFENYDVIQLRRTGKGCLSYVLASQNEAVIVDASLPIDVYEGILDQYSLTLNYVIETHIHADHLSRSRQLAEKHRVPLLLPAPNKVDFKFERLETGGSFPLGHTKIKAVSTPGHTLESATFFVDEKVIFTGDTLFIDGVGRPDLKAAEEETLHKAKLLHQSLQFLLSLPDDTVIFPAHTSQPVDFDNIPVLSTINEAKTKIPMLLLDENAFTETLLQRIPQTPANYLAIVEKNLKGEFSDIDPIDLEAGANRCAVS